MSTQKICAALVTGKHCIDASNLKEDQMLKYADSAKNAIVNRTLEDGSEGMVARALHQVLEPQKENTGQFKLIEVTHLQPQELPPSTRPATHLVPKETLFNAQWYTQYEMPASATDGSSNAFGGFGTIKMSSYDSLSIPVVDALYAPDEFLAAYGVKLVHLTEPTQIDFGKSADLMLFQYDVHTEYFDKYIKTPKGGGVYLETHNDFPHLAIPLHPSCGGSYTVGRQIGTNEYAIVSFKINYGWALVIAPGAIHDDATLTGPYIIGLTTNVDTEHVNTALMRTKDDRLMDAVLINPSSEPLSGDGITSIKQCKALLFAQSQMSRKTNLESLARSADKRPEKERLQIFNYLKSLPADTLSELRHLSDTAQEAYDQTSGLALLQ
ncbi:hypothetical protein Lsan_1273 [Legionella santicrucis]|uniref:Uncharacterized protein n=1 Tax=Legionella santicrucis TaxID=45074 RepID=A0A0W0Z3X0_9GAMM|nr:hypothetical protein [Legionella santicrucis]KTD63840.1 hypothetical protein Lsan_1273 [Legionella santicrucis]